MVVIVVLVLGFQSWGLSTDFSIRRKSRTRFISSYRGWNSGSIVLGISGWRKTWKGNAKFQSHSHKR